MASKVIAKIFKAHGLILNVEKELESYLTLLEILEEKFLNVEPEELNYVILKEYISIIEKKVISIEEKGNCIFLVRAEELMPNGWGCTVVALGSFTTERKAVSFMKIQRVKHREYNNMQIIKIPLNAQSCDPIEIVSVYG